MASYTQFLEDVVTSLGGGSLDWQKAYEILNEVDDCIYDYFFDELKYVSIEAGEIDPVALVYKIIKEEALNEIEEKIEEHLEEIIEIKRKKYDEDDEEDFEEEIMDRFGEAKNEIYVYGNYLGTCYDCSSELKNFLEAIQLEKIVDLSQTSKWFISKL